MEHIVCNNWDWYDARRNVKPGDTVLMRQGTYTEAASLEVPLVTWRSYPGEVATFDFADLHGGKGQLALVAKGITLRGLQFRCCEAVRLMATDCIMRGCHVTNAFCSSAANAGGGAISVEAEYCTVEDCVIENSGGNTQKNANGTIHGNTDHGIYVSVPNTKILRCYSGFSASGNAFTIGHGKVVLKDILVEGCVFHSPGGNSPVVNIEGEDVIFRDNVVLSQGSQARAVDLFWCPKRLTLTDNVIASTGTAIRCAYGPDGDKATVLARRNSIYGDIIAETPLGPQPPLKPIEWLEGGIDEMTENNQIGPGRDILPFPDAGNRIRNVRKMIGI